jgi:hypothetical protein
MHNIEVYHLKSRDLIKLERTLPDLAKGELDLYEHAKGVVGFYRNYVSMSLLRNPANDKQKVWEKKIDSVKALMESGWISHVATVKAPDLIGALKLTSDSHTHWFLNKKNKPNIELHEIPTRETTMLDVLVIKGHSFISVRGGFIDFQTAQVLQP